MMPLSFAKIGEENLIKKIGGAPAVRRHLENLGFTTGGNVTVVAENNGYMIVNVRESRLAISRDMANKILI